MLLKSAVKAAIKNGRKCVRIVSDWENFERIMFSVAEETKELRSAARPLYKAASDSGFQIPGFPDSLTRSDTSVASC